MACFPPVRPWVVPGPSGFRFLEAPAVLFKTTGLLLSCTSTPPKRLAPTLATTPSVPCRPWSGKNRTSHKLFGPTAFPETEALLFTPGFTGSGVRTLPCSHEVSP
jgi:hypothetical protein